jgi:hypothetical protein
VIVHPSSNAEFIEQHAAPARIGLCGGKQLINKLIRKAQGPLTTDGHRSMWSHAFLFSERRVDGQWWVIESDLDLHSKHVRLGVQENRASRYFDAEQYPNIAILDFGLDATQALAVQRAALDALSGLTTYSLGELVGTLLSLHSRRLRMRENLLAKEGALYCSAFVQHCYDAVGIRFQSGIHGKNLAPYDIETSPLPHAMHSLIRDPVTNPKPRTRYRLKRSAR